MNYGITHAEAPFGFVPYYRVSLCVVATNSCVEIFGWSYVPYLPSTGSLTNRECVTKSCKGYVGLSWIGTGYAYTA